jgi:hypothetical protein
MGQLWFGLSLIDFVEPLAHARGSVSDQLPSPLEKDWR